MFLPFSSKQREVTSVGMEWDNKLEVDRLVLVTVITLVVTR
jgi:hypothetical protein